MNNNLDLYESLCVDEPSEKEGFEDDYDRNLMKITSSTCGINYSWGSLPVYIEEEKWFESV